jgi:carbamoyltransferase
VRCVPHHIAHGLYAHAASGFDESAVLIIDSLDETRTTSIASAATRAGGGVRYRIMESASDQASLGYAYGAVTMHLGWRRGDEEGTVMALATLGDPDRPPALARRPWRDRVRARGGRGRGPAGPPRCDGARRA